MATQSMMKGQPTGMQARKLADRWIEMGWDQMISHQEVAEILGVPYRSNRYGTLITAARKIVGEPPHGFHMEAEISLGYVKCTGPAQMRSGLHKIRLSSRAMSRGLRRIQTVDDSRLTETQRRARDHILANAHAVHDTLKREQRKMMFAFNKPESLPPVATAGT